MTDTEVLSPEHTKELEERKYSIICMFVPYVYLSYTCMGRPIRVYSYRIPTRVWDGLLSHMSICHYIAPAQPRLKASKLHA